MEIKQPLSINDPGCLDHNKEKDDSTCFEEAATRDASAEFTTRNGEHHHDCTTCTVTIAESFSCRSPEKTREPDVLDRSSQRDQSTIDSSDTPPKVEGFERLQEPGGEETIASQVNDGSVASQGGDGQMNAQIADRKNALLALNEDFLLPTPLHMYSRRKKAKKACLSKSENSFQDVHNTVANQKACSLDELKRYTCSSRAVQSNVVKEKPNEGFSRGGAKLTSCQDDEGFRQKHAKSKCASSLEKKRGRNVATLVDDRKIHCPSTPGVNGSVSIGSSEYAAVRVGLQSCTPTLIEKARFKDELKQKDGLRQYLECRNFILGLWERDVCQTLSITACGLSDVAAPEETSQKRFLRDIYDFLNHHGFINAGVAAKKPRLSSLIQTGGKSSDCHKARLFDGLEIADEKLVDKDSEIEIMSRVRPTLVPCRRKEASSDLEQAIVGYERKKKMRHGNFGHEGQEETMVLDKNFKVKEFQNNLTESSLRRQSVCSGREAGSELTSVKPSDEELLLDIKNRIKARNKKKKLSLHGISTSVAQGLEESKDVRMTECEDIKSQINVNKSRAPMVERFCSGDHERVAGCAHEKQLLQKTVIVVGAGPAGLAAARHLQNMDTQVLILEARDRVGGRVFTDRTSFSGPVDLGANIVTGVEPDMETERRPDPAALLCKQLNLELTILQGECPLFDAVKGSRVSADTDKALESDFNCFLDETSNMVVENEIPAMQMSLQAGLKLAFRKYKALASHEQSGKKLKCARVGQAKNLCASSMLFSKENIDFSLAQRVMSWHFSSLEHRCGAELSKVALPYWNHDNAYGGFAGPHCMIKGGFSTIMEALGADVEIHLEQVVTKIDYACKDDGNGGCKIQVLTKGGAMFKADAVLLTVPLGCMKSNLIQFSPPLPDWKTASIQRLGFGLTMKVVMEFPVCFWDQSVDSFGCTAELTETRGRCFLFSNLKSTSDFPILSALIVGKAAVEDEQKEDAEVLDHALLVLRKLFGETAVPQPTVFKVTRWGSDLYSKGAFSYVAVGASDKDHDTLGQPVGNRLFFAGEATCKEHPGTVGGAMMSGLREAVRMLNVLHNRVDHLSEAEAIGAVEKHCDTQGDDVKEILRRLSSATKIGKLGRPLSKVSLLQDLFGVPKTNSGRLLVATEMLQLPESSLKTFLNTKASLMVLNSWIQGSMGKDGKQLLRLCLQLLLVVESSLSLVRRSGIESTVKNKVSMHANRDIRATACQLLKLWTEAAGKIKVAHGHSKPLQKSTNCQKLIQRKKGKGVKVLSSQVGAVPKGNRATSQANNLLKENPFCPVKDISQGNPVKPMQALNTEGLAPDTVKDGNVPYCENSGQALELSTPAVEAEPTVSKATELAPAKALELVEGAKSKQPELPKILSFQKFAKRDHIDSTKRRPLLRETLILYGKDLVTSGADARQSKVRDWSIDFSDSCSYLGSPTLLAMLDNHSSRDGFSAVVPDVPGISSTEIAGERHESGLTSNQEEEGLPDSKEVTDDDASAGSSMAGSQRRQSGICLASLTSGNMPLNAPLIEEDKPASDHHQCSDALNPRASIFNHPCADVDRRVSLSHSAEKKPESAEGHCYSFNEANDASAGSSVRLVGEQQMENQKTLDISPSLLVLDGEKNDNSVGALSKPVTDQRQKFSLDTSEQVKKAVTEYVAHLLTPLYKTKRINKDSFKSIMKKAIAKVMERRTEEEASMEATEFMDTKRKIKIRSLIDKLVERYLESVYNN